MGLQIWKRLGAAAGMSVLLGSISVPTLADEAVKRGGTLRYGTVSEVASLDPHVAAGSAWRALVGVLYSSLVTYDKHGDIVPALAVSWEQPDPQTLVFHLREDARFQDGSPVTAEDVRFSLERIVDPATGATLRSNLQGARIETPDASTIRISKDSPDVTLLSVLAMTEAAIVPKQWVQGGANLKLEANGAGPFRLASYEPSVRASLERNPSYYVEGQPYLESVDFRMIKSDDARVNALRSQSLDMIDFVPWKDIASLSRNPAFEVDTAGGAFMSVWFNATRKPFDDPRVRQAVSYALDRDAVSKAAFFGHGTPITGAPTASDSQYFNPGFEGTYNRDLDKARALLAEAGYPDGLDMSLLVFQGLGIYTTTAQILQANLKEAGINLTLEPVEWATLVERKNRGDYDAMIYGVSVKLPDPDAYAYYLGADSSFWAKPIGYRDEQLEQLLAQGRAQTDPEQRKLIYRDVEQRVLETSPWVFINWREQAQGYARKVQGYQQLGGALSESSPAISLPTIWMK